MKLKSKIVFTEFTEFTNIRKGNSDSQKTFSTF